MLKTTFFPENRRGNQNLRCLLQKERAQSILDLKVSTELAHTEATALHGYIDQQLLSAHRFPAQNFYVLNATLLVSSARSETVCMDTTTETKKPVSPATVGLYPLIAVDPVKSCCSEKFERPEINITFRRIRQMMPRLSAFTDEYRRRGGKILWIQSTPWREEYLPTNINRLYRENPSATFYTEHDVEESVEFANGITPREPDAIFTKNTYSAFGDARLQTFFRKHRWDTYLLAGVFAEACVNATLIDGFTKGLFTIILSDLVETMDDEEQQVHKTHLLTHQWPFMYGHVMTSREFLKKLAQ